MAGHDLIDAYLSHLGTHVGWRVDADDIVAEVADHLHTAAERAESLGADTRTAQQETLDRFGDPDLVATAFAETDRGGIAVPTHFSKQAGTVALVTAAMWLVFPLTWVVADRIEERTGEWQGASQAVFMVGTLALISAFALTIVVMMGLRERLGGLGPVATVGLLFTGLGTVASLLSWLIMGWATMLAIGTLLFATASWRADIAPRSTTLAFGGAWTLGLISWVTLRAAEVGSVDGWGDYWVANWSLILLGPSVFAVGMVGLGRWLRSEERGDFYPSEPYATA